jgi:thiamine pyrophosphate-dependent acetolactate synthase large subunit-like protein
MMIRTDCLAEIAKVRGDTLVVAVYSAAFEWMEISPHPLNFFPVGAMGQASSSALGFAIGLPDRKIIVLDGDGSLLMNLGSLVTIAGVAPDNLIHFVCQNGCYEANGEHPIPGQGLVSFAGLARAAGYRTVVEFSDIEGLRSGLSGLMQAPGPSFATLFVRPGVKPQLDYSLIHGAAARECFQTGLANAMKDGKSALR